MTRKLTEKEEKVLRAANLTLRAEHAVRKHWGNIDAPPEVNGLIPLGITMLLPTVTSIFATRAFLPQYIPAGFENIAWLLLSLFLLFGGIGVLAATATTSKSPLDFVSIRNLVQSPLKHFYRLLWFVLVISVAWHGNVGAAFFIAIFWLAIQLLGYVGKQVTVKKLKEIENDPNPITIEIN
jgi:hypothetical protein